MKQKKFFMIVAILVGMVFFPKEVQAVLQANPNTNGVKTDKSDKEVTDSFVNEHVKIGIKSLTTLINRGSTVKHLRFDW